MQPPQIASLLDAYLKRAAEAIESSERSTYHVVVDLYFLGEELARLAKQHGDGLRELESVARSLHFLATDPAITPTQRQSLHGTLADIGEVVQRLSAAWLDDKDLIITEARRLRDR